MLKLEHISSILDDNEFCTILKIDESQSLALIKMGCFNGDEKTIRLAKDNYKTITVFTDKTSYSWSRNTLVVDHMKMKRSMIENAVISLLYNKTFKER